MGTSLAKIRFNDGTIYYGGYQNTSDIITGGMFCKTYKELEDKSHDSMYLACKCKTIEPVAIAVNYGGGFYWNGKACKACGRLHEGYNPYPDSDISPYGSVPLSKQVKDAEKTNIAQDLKNGYPDWWKVE